MVVVAACVSLVAPPARAQTTQYNRIPLHRPESDLRLGAGVEVGSSSWLGLQGAVTTRPAPWSSVGGELAVMGPSGFSSNGLYPEVSDDYVVRAGGLFHVHTARALGMELSIGANGGLALERIRSETSATSTERRVRMGVAGGPVAGWHIFPIDALSLDVEVGALFVAIERSFFTESSAASGYGRLGVGVHLR